MAERHLAKVEVASSNLVARSMKKTDFARSLSFFYGQENGSPGRGAVCGHISWNSRSSSARTTMSFLFIIS